MGTNSKKAEYCVISECYAAKAMYAKTELEKYIYQLTGCAAGGTAGRRITFTLRLAPECEELGEEGYGIRMTDGGQAVCISAFCEQGLLYGVYGLLDEFYGVGFYFSGDAIPQRKAPLPLLDIDVCRVPEQQVRGVLPWTNFPQSATSYSLQDWSFIIDQAARMRMNFLNIHNYSGELGHNEIFHNILLNGEMSRNWNATAAKPHAWGMKGWDVNQYRFGGREVFDDYDFGADAALHNDCLPNIDVFRKGSSEFAAILQHAHRRGVKIGLGIDLNLVPSDYNGAADDATLAQARIDQIISDYPTLDYLLLYRSENAPNFEVWNCAFQHTYQTVKARAANIRIAVSGWGLDPDTIVGLPRDVIAAPISGHGVNDKFPDGSIYGDREFWACPWAERDYNDSVHFAPYNTHLSTTVACYRSRSANTKGLMTLTWRLSDAVDAKLAYIAGAPWDADNRLSTAEAAYRRYAERCYGADAAACVTDIISENEAFASNASECLYTPKPTGLNRAADIAKAEQQLAVIDGAIAACPDHAWVERLNRLRCRIQAVHAFCRLDQDISRMDASQLAAEFRVFVRCFIDRIDDISTLGNLFSIENRYVQEWFLPRAEQLRAAGEEIPDAPAGGGLRVLCISPPTALSGAGFADFRATVLHSASPESLSATLFLRAAGASWRAWPMSRRVKGSFGLRVPMKDLPTGVIEYYIEAADGTETARYPATAPSLCAAASVVPDGENGCPAVPRLTAEANGRLRWTPCDGDVLWYRIYRGTQPDFTVGPQSFVTYVHRDTLTYLDCTPDFDGEWLNGNVYYRVACVNAVCTEGAPSNEVCCRILPPQLMTLANSGTVPATLLLGHIRWNKEITHLCVRYGAVRRLHVELRADGVLLGSAEFCSTGIAAVQETGEIPLLQTPVDSCALTLTVQSEDDAAWTIYDLYPRQGALREPCITTDAYSFSFLPTRRSLRLRAENSTAWCVKTLDGTPADGVSIDKDGLLTAERPQTVRAVSQTADGLTRERLITFNAPVAEAAPDAFDDFWMLSTLAGCDESVEIGGLVYGFDYTCCVREEEHVVCRPVRTANGSFKIPAEVLAPNRRYAVSVYAVNDSGIKRSITRCFETTDAGLLPLNRAKLLGVDAPCGSCVYTDEWGVRTNGTYTVTPEGLRLCTGPGDPYVRFCFRLPQPYTPERPQLLIKAAASSGDWTVQINLIPIVGPRENDVALRKDLRTFGFEPGTPIDLTLIFTPNQRESNAEAVFKSIQLLPDYS